MKIRILEKRTLWWPTFLGWLVIGAFGTAALSGWAWLGESFLAVTDRKGSGILVVESWIGHEGIIAAMSEFEKQSYSALLVVGSPTTNRWGRRQWNYAELARDVLVRRGFPREKLIVVATPLFVSHRTHSAAVAVRDALAKRGELPQSIDVLTLGAHSRRSRLVYARAFPHAEVGAIAWIPPGSATGPWWKSSERASDVLKETAGFMMELFFGGGRD